MAKKKTTAKAGKSGLQVKINLRKSQDEFGKKLKVKVTLTNNGEVISQDEDFVELPLR